MVGKANKDKVNGQGISHSTTFKWERDSITRRTDWNKEELTCSRGVKTGNGWSDVKVGELSEALNPDILIHLDKVLEVYSQAMARLNPVKTKRGIAVQWVKLPHVTLAFHIEVLLQVQAAVLPIQLHSNVPAKAVEDGPRTPDPCSP